MPEVVYNYLITPRPATDEKELEQFLADEVFPGLDVLQRNVSGTTHSLLKCKGEDGATQYLWAMTVDFVSIGTATGGIDEVHKAMGEKLKGYAGLSSRFAEVSVGRSKE